MFPRILITVGTTEFDDLLKVINTTEFCHVIKSMGCQSIAVQFGRGQITPSELVVNCEGEGIRVNDFRFSSSMEPHILQASLVISHAGAGSIIETLNSPNKPFLIVIVNESLMGNHQTELADAMAEAGYCVSSTPDKLLHFLCQHQLPELKPYPEANSSLFPLFLESLFE